MPFAEGAVGFPTLQFLFRTRQPVGLKNKIDQPLLFHMMFMFVGHGGDLCSSFDAAFAASAAIHCCAAFLSAILAALPANQHTLDCHATQLSSRLACNPKHLVCLSLPWPSQQAAHAMAMVCHRHLRLQDERLPQTREWCLIASQRSGVSHGFFCGAGACDGGVAAQVILECFAGASLTASTDHHFGASGAATHQRSATL